MELWGLTIEPMKNKYQMIEKNNLEEKIADIPNLTGCYLFLDKNQHIIYIGKSIKLRNRIRSYFRKSTDISPRIDLMVRQIVGIEFIVTDNEEEALALESNLIKLNKPYFNVLLKDDKKYPYICITWSDEYPRIFITRRRRSGKANDKFYGPYVDVGSLRKSLMIIKKIFPLRQRPRPLYKDRTCLNYSIGRCPGVCQGKISSDDYRNTLKKVEMVIQGRSEDLNNILMEQMKNYSDKMDFEKAAATRDQIRGIEQLSKDQKVIDPDVSVNRDIIAMACNSKIASIQIFQMRKGKLIARLAYTANCKEFDSKMVLQKVVEEHYSQADPIEIPAEVIVEIKLPNNELIEEWLGDLRKRKVRLYSPKRSKKHDLLALVRKNAEIELNRLSKGHKDQELAVEDLTQLLESTSTLRRIEGYDISHIQGSDVVGSQVVFIDGLPAKQHYRKYKIRSSEIFAGHSDDYAAMSEVINRRFKRWASIKNELGDLTSLKEMKKSYLDANKFDDWPDLIVIDGGKGQLSSALKTLRQLNLEEEVTICSLAKRREEVFLPGLNNPINTAPDTPGVKLLRRLRDEAHRFAIKFHREQREKRQKRSHLSEIPGLGSKRIRDLLSYFNSIEAIQLATIEQLSNAPGIGNSTARDIWKYFHPNENNLND